MAIAYCSNSRCGHRETYGKIKGYAGKRLDAGGFSKLCPKCGAVMLGACKCGYNDRYDDGRCKRCGKVL